VNSNAIGGLAATRLVQKIFAKMLSSSSFSPMNRRNNCNGRMLCKDNKPRIIHGDIVMELSRMTTPSRRLTNGPIFIFITEVISEQ